jgi:Leucine-rich repeat (LRR) protein
MGKIKINNDKVLDTIKNTVKKKQKQTGLGKFFFNRVTEKETKNVKKLDFEMMNITDLDFLRYFPDLESLSLSKVTGIKDTSGLAYCHNLESLMIYDTYIEDFQSLQHCKELDNFHYICIDDAANCAREDFRFLQNFSKLIRIDLSGNKVEDISFLSGHPNLVILVLDKNPIRSIAPLKTIKKLDWLEVSSCGLSELEDIEQFPALTYLCAIDNKFDYELILRYKEILKYEDEVEL